MQSEVAELPLESSDVLEQVIIKGDLAKLTPQERVQYYKATCESLGLNPLTRPLAYINLNNQLRLYALRDCTDQLRKLHRISVEIISQKVDGELYIVHARARAPSGRTDEDFGAVTIANLKGEARANAIMKTVTKSKRRVTLSIAGLGFLDETEVGDDTPIATGAVDITDTLDQWSAEEETLLQRARRSTLRGSDSYRDFFVSLTTEQRKELLPYHEELKEAADRADQEPEAVGR